MLCEHDRVSQYETRLWNATEKECASIDQMTRAMMIVVRDILHVANSVMTDGLSLSFQREHDERRLGHPGSFRVGSSRRFLTSRKPP